MRTASTGINQTEGSPRELTVGGDANHYLSLVVAARYRGTSFRFPRSEQRGRLRTQRSRKKEEKKTRSEKGISEEFNRGQASTQGQFAFGMAVKESEWGIYSIHVALCLGILVQK